MTAQRAAGMLVLVLFLAVGCRPSSEVVLDLGEASDGAGLDGAAEGPRPLDAGARGEPQPTLERGAHGQLPPPPAGAVLLRISVDDTTDKTYAAQELRLHGSFSFDEKTYQVRYDSKWSGPDVPLHDDGPSGLEGPGSVAGDHRLGAVVYVVPSGPLNLEYGLVSPAGWMWPGGGNHSITVQPGDKLKDLQPCKLPPRDGVDVTWTVDAAKLSGLAVHPGYEMVVVRSSTTHWSALPCNDDGASGDPQKGDGAYTCRLSEHIGKGKLFPHLGLAQPGSALRFQVEVGASSYHQAAGVSVTLRSASGSAAASVSTSGPDLLVSVPAGAAPLGAPPADSSPLPAGLRGDAAEGLLPLPAGVIKGLLYVPGAYDAHRPAPLLVALHGAFESGQWMIDVWKTLAEQRGMLLLAPSSSGKSWDLTSVFAGKPALEEAPLLAAIAWVQGRYRIDASRIGVEGFSDGASMALCLGLGQGKRFNVALASSAGGLGKGCYPRPDKPAVYLTHGDADAVLPVSNARWIKSTLTSLGYEVVYHELPGVGHVFPTDHKIPMLRYLEEN